MVFAKDLEGAGEPGVVIFCLCFSEKNVSFNSFHNSSDMKVYLWLRAALFRGTHRLYIYIYIRLCIMLSTSIFG